MSITAPKSAQILRSFRLVCDPEQINAVEDFLKSEGYEFESEPFSPYCRKLVCEPRPLGSSLAAFFGYIYIQDRSSMLSPLALNPDSGTAVLDMCASPGSKTGFLGQLVGKNGFVLANEPNTQRLGTLRANIRQMNLLQIATCTYRGERLPLVPNSWDFILLDPPCSGWGTENKHPNIRNIWKDEKINKLVKIQRSLLRKATELLAPGGKLLYSTCTTNKEENEAQTLFAEQELTLSAVDLEPFAGFTVDRCGKGSFLIDGEASSSQGFYISLLQKANNSQNLLPHINSMDFSSVAINKKLLDSNIFNSASLPPGIPALFGENVRFLSHMAQKILPRQFKWQAPILGHFKQLGKNFVLDPHLRTLIAPDTKKHGSIIFENICDLRAILNGNSCCTNIKAARAPLFWKNLPLCIAQIKNGRIIVPFS